MLGVGCVVRGGVTIGHMRHLYLPPTGGPGQNTFLLGERRYAPVLAVVTFLEERGLPFIGHHEHIGSRQNSNFLRVMVLIGEFEPCLAKHVDEFGYKGRRKPS